MTDTTAPTTYTVDLTGVQGFSAAITELRKLAKMRDADGPLANYQGETKTWTVRDTRAMTSSALSYLRMRGATVTEQATDPTAQLRAERERLIARLAEIDALLGGR